MVPLFGPMNTLHSSRALCQGAGREATPPWLLCTMTSSLPCQCPEFAPEFTEHLHFCLRPPSSHPGRELLVPHLTGEKTKAQRGPRMGSPSRSRQGDLSPPTHCCPSLPTGLNCWPMPFPSLQCFDVTYKSTFGCHQRDV